MEFLYSLNRATWIDCDSSHVLSALGRTPLLSGEGVRRTGEGALALFMIMTFVVK